MNLLDLVEDWAKSKGWWVFKATPSDDGYLYICKHNPYSWKQDAPNHITPFRTRNVFTLWANAKWDMNGEYPIDPEQKLEPADPDFFLNLERLVITKT